MRIFAKLMPLVFLGSLVGVTTLLPACSGDKDAAEEPVEGSKDDKSAEAAPDEAAAGDTSAADAEAAAPAPTAAPAAPAPAPAPAAAPADDGFSGAKVTRYVRTYALKIHPQPDKTSPTIGWVKKGDKVDVVINGEWAKLDNGKFISAKFLTEKPTKPSKAVKKKK